MIKNDERKIKTTFDEERAELSWNCPDCGKLWVQPYYDTADDDMRVIDAIASSFRCVACGAKYSTSMTDIQFVQISKAMLKQTYDRRQAERTDLIRRLKESAVNPEPPIMGEDLSELSLFIRKNTKPNPFYEEKLDELLRLKAEATKNKPGDSPV